MRKTCPPPNANAQMTHPLSTSNPSLSPFRQMLGSPSDDIAKKTKVGRPTELSFTGLKSLLQDIQNRGGLKGLNLTDVCDNNTEELGAPGSTLRRSVQNKVGDWKRNPDRYHSDQLDTLGFLFERLESPLSLTPTPVSPPPTNKSSQRVSLSRLLDNMSLNDHYGAVPHDIALNVNFAEAWNNDGAFIFKAPAVTVGQNPSVSTDVLVVLIEDVDQRWFQFDDFEPFKMTQVSPNKFVLEKPAAGYETLRPAFETEEDWDDDAFVVSETEQIQNEYKIARNNLLKRSDGVDYSHLRKKTLFTVESPHVLDFTLMDPDKRHGEVDYDFVANGKQSLAVEFRIAYKPEAEARVVKQRRKNRNQAKDKFARFQANFMADSEGS